MPKPPVMDILPPVEIPLMQPPIPGDIEGADGGIGLRHVDNSFVVHIARPANTPELTTFQLFWGSSPQAAATNIIREGDEKLTRIPFTVRSDFVRPSWADPVYVRVIRRSGNPSETERLRLRVNLLRPGGRDDNPAPGNQNLVFVLPPDLYLQPVSDARAREGIEIIVRAWLNMAFYDLLIVTWGSQTVTHRVQQREVGQDIPVTIRYETVVAAGNAEFTPVQFQVEGPTGNFPQEGARWSATELVTVELGITRPPAPIVSFPEDVDRDIDLIALGGRDVEIGARVSAADARDYAFVTLVWAGTDSEGAAVNYLPYQTLSSGRLYYFNIENPLVAAVAKGTVIVHSLLQGGVGGLPDKPSYNLHLRVIGDVVTWPAPTVDEALAGYLDPNVAQATVRFPAQASWPADARLEVVLVSGGADDTIEYSDGRRVDAIAPTPAGDMVFIVPRVEVDRFNGRRTDVYYTVTRAGAGSVPQSSVRLSLQVGEPAGELPKPLIVQAPSGQLDPDEIVQYANVIAPYTGTLRSDWITLYWIGPAASTSVRVEVAVNGNFTQHDILKDYITPNLGEQVTVFYTLERSRQPTRYSHIATVQIGQGLGELVPPDLTRANITGPGTATLAPLDVQAGTTLVVSYVDMRDSDLIQVIMQGTAGAGSPMIPGKPGNQATERVEFDITKGAIAANIRSNSTTVRFTYTVTRDGKTDPSLPLTVTVTPIPASELQKTVIRINQANQTTKVLDLSAVTGGGTTRVGTWPFITSGWPVWLTLTGQKNDGTSHSVTVWNGAASAAVDPNWISAGFLEAAVTYANLQQFGDGKVLTMQFKAAFSTSKVEADAIAFPPVTYTVNSVPATFPVPKLTPTTGSGTSVTLTTMSATGGATVSVEYLPMYTTDSIKVTMVGTAGAGSPVIATKTGLVSGVLPFSIPATAIGANIGNTNRTFTLKYDVTRTGTTRPSTTLTVTVPPIPLGSLPTPRINNVASGGVLDVPSLPSSAKLTIAQWPFQYANMKIWLTYRCTGATPNPNVIWAGASHAATNGLEYAAPLAWLATCPNGGIVTVEFKVGYIPNATEAQAVSFPVATYTVRSVVVVEETNFNNQNWNGWTNRTASGELRNSGTNLYWWGQGNGEFQCGLRKVFAYSALPFGVLHRIELDFSNTQPWGCLIQITSDGRVLSHFTGADANKWIHASYNFTPNFSSTNANLIIEVFNYPYGGAINFTLDNIKITRP